MLKRRPKRSMRGPSFRRVRENETGIIHIDAPPQLRLLTLCGMTEWKPLTTHFYHHPGQVINRGAVTCMHCRSIAEYCKSHRKLTRLINNNGKGKKHG